MRSHIVIDTSCHDTEGLVAQSEKSAYDGI